MGSTIAVSMNARN